MLSVLAGGDCVGGRLLWCVCVQTCAGRCMVDPVHGARTSQGSRACAGSGEYTCMT